MMTTTLEKPTSANKAAKLRELSQSDIECLFDEKQAFDFVVLDNKHPPRWVPEEHTIRFWDEQASGRIANPENPYFSAASFLSGYGYSASEWAFPKRNRGKVVVLKVCH